MTEHTHTDSKGVLHKCYHECKQVFTQTGFWIGTLTAWPLEHALYSHVWPFTLVSKFFGIAG